MIRHSRAALLALTSLALVATLAAAAPFEENGILSRARRDRLELGEERRVEESPLPPAAALRLPSGKALRGPIDEQQYIVGPGDAFAVMVVGGTIETQRVEVTPEGDVVLPVVGAVAVAGRNLVAAKKAISDALASHYRNVQVQISLVELRRIEVHVVGHVVRPGTYIGTALDPTSVMLDVAGGLGFGASRRNIRVVRRNGEERRIDLVRYERTGDLESNPPILDGDVIRVPFAKSKLRIDGAVERPGDYEFVEGDTLGGLVEMAGGLTRDARRDSVELRRFVDDLRSEESHVALDRLEFPLQDGDQIYVGFSREFRPMRSVTLEGEFVRPGPYGIAEGTDRLSDVIRRAGGFTPEASLAEAQLLREHEAPASDAEFERLRNVPAQNMSPAEAAYLRSKSREHRGLVVLDFVALSEGDESQDRLLENGDRVVVPKRGASVMVSGNVKSPGLVGYVPGKRAGYYVEQAGGYSSNADRGDSRVIRRSTGGWEPLGDAGVVLPGDEVWISEEGDRNWWQLAREAVAFTASIATVYLVVQQVTD